MGLKKMNYFKGEFLTAEDFKDEQQYHVDMLRVHNKNLHEWGIAQGLDISYKTGENTIIIKNGMAIDAEGRQIILDEDREEKIPVNNTATEFYITICYNEEYTDLRSDYHEKPENTRIEAKPKMKLYKVDEPLDKTNCLILAKVILDEKNNIVELDLKERKYTTAEQSSGYLSRQSIVFVNFNQADIDGIPKITPREKIGFVPRTVLISGGFQVKLGEEMHGGTFSGFWANGSTGCSYPIIIKNSPTDVQIFSQTHGDPFHLFVHYNGRSEIISGTIDFSAKGMAVTLHRDVQGNSDPISSFSISLCMLCIG